MTCSNMQGIHRLFWTSSAVLLITQHFILVSSVSYDEVEDQFKQHRNNFRQRFQRGNSVKRQSKDTEYVTMEQYNSDMETINSNINLLVSMNKELSTQIVSVNITVGSNTNRIAAVETQQQEAQKTPPLFFARLTEIVRYDYGEIYQFDDVLVNTGGGSYDVNSGKYTIGKEGYYLVAVMLYGQALASYGNYRVYGELYKGDQWLTTLDGTNNMDSGYGELDNLQASSTVIVHCKQGELLYVKGLSGGGTSERTDLGNFNVMFIHA